jgi:hypothetical protein
MLQACRRNARRDIRSVTHRFAIPIEAHTQRTHSDVLSQLATTPDSSFKIGDQQNTMTQWNSDRRAIDNATHFIDTRCGVFRHQGVSDGSDGARSLWLSHSTRTEYLFADVDHLLTSTLSNLKRHPSSCKIALVHCQVLCGMDQSNNVAQHVERIHIAPELLQLPVHHKRFPLEISRCP